MLDDQALTTDQKADFSRLYQEPDPRRYFRTLCPMGYQVPTHALPVFRAVLAGLGRRCDVLDLCCSYGINGALLRCEVSLDELSARYADPVLGGLSTAALAAQDRGFVASRLRADRPRVLGLDASSAAIDYATRVGTLSGGWAEDLEHRPPSAELVAGLRSVGVVICTGGVGYIGPRTFSRLLEALPSPSSLWLVVFVLRVFSYAEIAAVLGRYGLITERVPGLTVRQRRFADRAEFDAANHDVRALGLDPTGREATGWYYADCYLTRPAAAPLTCLESGFPDTERQ
jgi:hypothetical protein